MLYNILSPYANNNHLANLFTYISFRAILALLISFVVSLYLGPKLITYLRNLRHNQPIRTDGPVTHLQKAGTPTMGGLLIIFTTLLATLLLANLANIYIWVTLLVLVSFGVLGFMDDYLKVTKQSTAGVAGKAKIVVQLLVSIIVFVVISYYDTSNYANHLAIPFLKKVVIDLGYFYLPWMALVIIGTSNAVNLTDGLDGLAAGTVIIAVSAFSLITYLVGHNIYANYLQLIYVPRAAELVVLCAAIIGSCLGFLWFNAKPAEIFMGDTGSLALGGVLGIISVIIKHELILVIVGGVFVIETLSVILQVASYRLRGGRRIFLMAPIHHHFEKKGWPETKVVIRFWIMGLLFALLGIASLKLR